MINNFFTQQTLTDAFSKIEMGNIHNIIILNDGLNDIQYSNDGGNTISGIILANTGIEIRDTNCINESIIMYFQTVDNTNTASVRIWGW